MFADLNTNSEYAAFDGTNFLTEEEDESIFGPESSCEIDTSSDHEPLEEDYKIEEDDNEEILHEYEQRERRQRNSNSYSYDNNNDHTHLGSCNAKCDGAWICCDTCSGWKCVDHWYDEYGVDLDDFDADYVDSIYFNCDLCINLVIDTINVQRQYLDDFRQKYFGRNGVRSEKILEESTDSKWVGLSIDVLVEYCMDNEWDIEEIEDNVLSNYEIMNEGKILFIELFQDYKNKCIDSKFEPLFDYDVNSVIESFMSLKKNIIRYIMAHISDYYDDTMNDIAEKELNKFKKQIYYFVDKQINIQEEYIQIRTLWNVSVAELRSESIVESICSVLKKIYTPDRGRLKHITLEMLLQLRLSLPLTKAQRDMVIQKVIKRYYQLYPAQITHKITKAQRQKRQKKGLNTSPTMHKWEQLVQTAFTVPFD